MDKLCVTSRHGAARAQQRGICPLVIDLLMQFGATEPSGDGATKFFFNKSARKKLAIYAGSLSGLLQEYMDVYAVIGANDTLVTVGHRQKRIQRH